ncbi:MAG TPA: hypothetical protein VKC66_26415 [Xanthobacteraceae bacterium]|nr:hypothetical protein [Xanthobacteraceae bacterium]
MSTAAFTVVVGSPQTARERIARICERRFNILACMLQFGVMPDDLVKRNMEIICGGGHAVFPRGE